MKLNRACGKTAMNNHDNFISGEKMRYRSFLFLLVVAGVYADIAVTTDARKDLHLTVYRDFGVVRDVRKINIPEGANRIRFEGVATGINAESVALNWKSGAGIEMSGQSYEFDLVSPAKLMEKYVGREVEIIPGKDRWPDTSVQIAELISIDGKEPVFRIGTTITFGDIGRILFPYVPDNLYTIPTLVWNVFVPKRQKTEISATYLTEGISWNAGYLLKIDNKNEAGTFGGWITFKNESGLDCKDAKVTFVAGDVRRVRESRRFAAPDETVEKDLQQYGDYYFYSMNQRVSLLSNHSKQVEWIPAAEILLKQKYFAEAHAGMAGGVGVYKAVEVENTESNRIGIPLPEGVIRVFKDDGNNENRFIGENRLPYTEPGGSFYVPIGSTDGLSVEQQESGRNSYKIIIRNTKGKAVSLRFHLHTGGRRVTSVSKKYRNIGYSSLEWNIKVKSKEVYTITYAFK